MKRISNIALLRPKIFLIVTPERLTQPLLQFLAGIEPTAFGVGGIFAGAALVFFAYIGFEAVSVAAQESKNPQRDMPIGILGFDPNLSVYRTDIDKAREFMAKTEKPDGGFKLKMVHISGLEQQRRWSLIMLDSLKQLNIDLEIQPMSWPDMVAACKSPDTFPGPRLPPDLSRPGQPGRETPPATSTGTPGTSQPPAGPLTPPAVAAPSATGMMPSETWPITLKLPRLVTGTPPV